MRVINCVQESESHLATDAWPAPVILSRREREHLCSGSRHVHATHSYIYLHSTICHLSGRRSARESIYRVLINQLILLHNLLHSRSYLSRLEIRCVYRWLISLSESNNSIKHFLFFSGMNVQPAEMIFNRWRCNDISRCKRVKNWFQICRIIANMSKSIMRYWISRGD